MNFVKIESQINAANSMDYNQVFTVLRQINSCTLIPNKYPNYDAFLSIVCCFLVVTSIFEYVRKRVIENLDRHISEIIGELTKDSNGDQPEVVEYLSGKSKDRRKTIECDLNAAFHSYMIHSGWVYLACTVIIFTGCSQEIGYLNILSVYPVVMVGWRLVKIHKKERKDMQANRQEWEGHKKCEDFKKSRTENSIKEELDKVKKINIHLV